MSPLDTEKLAHEYAKHVNLETNKNIDLDTKNE